QLTNTLILLLLLAALYGLKQELIGFSDYEKWWVYNDPLRYDLYFIWGHMRIFSFMSDPSIFGILMACGAMFCFVLAMGPCKPWRKLFLWVSCGCMLLASVFAGTRTAYVVIPAAFFFFAFLTMRRDVLIICGLCITLGGLYVLKNPQNPRVYRIYSAFFPANDESYQVREKNQEYIQPYILSHPIGGGLGSTGVWGQRFSPHHFLAKFPPDSGYVMIAVEMGWIGLLLYCWMLFVAFREGVKRYFRARSEIIKNYYAAFLILLLGMTIANFAQLVFMQTPGNLTFYIILAILARLIHLEPEVLKKNAPAPKTVAAPVRNEGIQASA
ncbi:MAG: O-antigen ligase domain-containing protein, partial [Bacteroidetes bacterium]